MLGCKQKRKSLGILNIFCCLILMSTLIFSCCVAQRKTGEKVLRWVTKPEALQYLTQDMSEMDKFRQEVLNPLLVERISGTEGNAQVRQHIKRIMQNLGWKIEEDSFEDNTPFGPKTFVNVIATLYPDRPQRTVIACHYDSKDMKTKQGKTFIGAIDSAVPCAVMLETARQLDCLFLKGPEENSPVADLGLQFVFLDGEEAFERWTATDSIYGARHLADTWQSNSVLSSIREFILLDLIGTSDTKFVKLFQSTSTLYDHLVRAEQHLRSNSLLSADHTGTMFDSGPWRFRGIEDDHIPFLRKGVDILHLISSPFPSVWHKVEDDGDHLDFGFIDNFSRIFRVFVSNLMHLVPENQGCRKK